MTASVGTTCGVEPADVSLDEFDLMGPTHLDTEVVGAEVDQVGLTRRSRTRLPINDRDAAIVARTNRKVVLAGQPNGTPVDSDFTIVDEPVGALQPGLCCDPFCRQSFPSQKRPLPVGWPRAVLPCTNTSRPASKLVGHVASPLNGEHHGKLLLRVNPTI